MRSILLLGLLLGCSGRPSNTPSSWTVADSGFGPVTIGMATEEADGAVDGSLRLPQTMRTDGGCDYASLEGMDSLTFMIEQRKVVRVDVRRRDIRTSEGAGIGDSEAHIQQLYSGRVRVTPHKYTPGHYLTVVPSDTAGHPYRLIFETDGAVVTTFRAGALPQVAYVEGCS